MRACVTGIAGHLGSGLAEYLLSQGVEVVGIDNLSTGFFENVPKAATFVQGDVGPSTLLEALKKPVDVVYHFAAFASETSSHWCRVAAYKNVMATAHVVNACLMRGVPNLVFASSVAVYGSGVECFELETVSPMDPYGISKAACEYDVLAARDVHGLSSRIVRLHNCYGPGQSMWQQSRNVFGIWAWHRNYQLALPIYGDGTQRRQFTFAEDIYPIVQRIGEDDIYDGLVLNIGCDEETSIRDAAMIFGVAAGWSSFDHRPSRYEAHLVLASHYRQHRYFPNYPWTTLEDGLERFWNWAVAADDEFRHRVPAKPPYDIDPELYPVVSEAH